MTKIVHFNAAHRLMVPEWSDEKNTEVFGKCANPNWHGHNFDLEVTVCGTPDPVTGFIINLTDLKRIIKVRIEDKVDHRNLNLDVDFMQGLMPTIENFAIAIWNELKDHVSPAKLYSVKIWESNTSFVEYFG